MSLINLPLQAYQVDKATHGLIDKLVVLFTWPDLLVTSFLLAESTAFMMYHDSMIGCFTY